MVECPDCGTPLKLRVSYEAKPFYKCPADDCGNTYSVKEEYQDYHLDDIKELEEEAIEY